MSTPTRFASISDYSKGGVEIIGNDSARRYLFSNMFEVAARSAPWERVVIAKNLEFTVECVRAEGESPWYICAHDETALAMQGEVEIHFMQPGDGGAQPPAEKSGAVRMKQAPRGKRMGQVDMRRGHMALLPAGAAYQFRARSLGVLLIQTIQGEESRERWAAICQH